MATYEKGAKPTTIILVVGALAISAIALATQQDAIEAERQQAELSVSDARQDLKRARSEAAESKEANTTLTTELEVAKAATNALNEALPLKVSKKLTANPDYAGVSWTIGVTAGSGGGGKIFGQLYCYSGTTLHMSKSASTSVDSGAAKSISDSTSWPSECEKERFTLAIYVEAPGDNKSPIAVHVY